jgi:hypothetical protein
MPQRVPYYYLFRERAAALTLGMAARINAENAATPASGAVASRALGTLAETTLRSRDGLLLGRPDYVDPPTGEVVDYKTGAGPEHDPDGLSDAEARQLRLYVHLAREHSFSVRRGVVVRSDGRRIALDITEADAAAEGQLARETLAAFNATASEGFKNVAKPSREACRYCPCIPFCEPFWEAAAPSWVETCGSHVEGAISAMNTAVVQDTTLVTIELAVTRGTVRSRAAVVQQLPEAWACADGAPPPRVGDVVRVVNSRLMEDSGQSALLRPDRLTTALWTVRPAADAPYDPNSGE